MKNIDEYIQEAYEELVKFTSNKEIREECDAREKILRDNYNFLLDTKEQGLTEGRAEGLELGRAEGRAETLSLVKNMKRLQREGKSFEEIAAECSFSVEEVRDILE